MADGRNPLLRKDVPECMVFHMELVDFGSNRPPAQPAFTSETIRIRDGVFKSFGADHPARLREILVVGLGLVRSRKFWGDAPNGRRTILCESHDAVTGFPRPGSPLAGSELQCETCVHRKWQNRTPPKCSHIWTVPALLVFGAGGASHPTRNVLLEFTGRSEEPLQEYLAPFRDAKDPLYSCLTHVRLEQRSAGGREFAVPIFSRAATTDPSSWPNFSAELASARKQLAPPERVELEAMPLPGS